MEVILASSSQTRHRLLIEAGIPFTATTHNFDERNFKEEGVTPQKLASILARQKALHAVMPSRKKEPALVIGVDTIVYDQNKRIYHKPKSFDEAYHILEQSNNKTLHVATGLSCTLYEACNQELIELKTITTKTDIILSYPINFIQKYLEQHADIFTRVAGGLILEGFGAQYIKEIHGSYTGALGLPMSELIILLQEYNK